MKVTIFILLVSLICLATSVSGQLISGRYGKRQEAIRTFKSDKNCLEEDWCIPGRFGKRQEKMKRPITIPKQHL